MVAGTAATRASSGAQRGTSAGAGSRAAGSLRLRQHRLSARRRQRRSVHGRRLPCSRSKLDCAINSPAFGSDEHARLRDESAHNPGTRLGLKRRKRSQELLDLSNLRGHYRAGWKRKVEGLDDVSTEGVLRTDADAERIGAVLLELEGCRIRIAQHAAQHVLGRVLTLDAENRGALCCRALTPCALRFG